MEESNKRIKIKRIRITTCGLIWEETFRKIFRYPTIFLPYSILVLLEVCLLIFLFLSYLPILSPLLRPPIRVFFGEIYLHYPYNLAILPTLFDYCNIVLLLIIGPLISGMTVGMVYQTEQGNKPKFYSNLLLGIKKYLILFGVWVIVTLLIFTIFQLGKFLVLKFYTDRIAEIIHIPTWRMTRLVEYFCFFLTLIIETLFAFCIPAVMIEGKKLLSSIRRTFKISLSIFLPTFILICVPNIFNSMIVLIKQRMLTQLMDKFFPEVVFIIMGVGFCVYLITQVIQMSSITLTFLVYKNLEKKEAENDEKST